MLTNVTYSNPEITRKIDSLVGKPFTLKERIRMGGVGSPPFVIRESSLEIRNLLILDNNRNRCNIELRPGGIIIGFRSLLESFVLAIPYYKLSILKGDLGVCTLHIDHHFMRLETDTRATQKFLVRILNAKAAFSPSTPKFE
jgi:hypothetical protein